MKSTIEILGTSILRLTILLLIISSVGYIIYQYFQPLCEPCLTDNCPPCISSEQYLTIYLFAFLDLILMIRIVYLAIKNKRI